MNIKKAKFIMLALAFIFIFFFSSDFGLIDVEKTSIITAFAIDLEKDGKYTVSAQIAVPEATDTNSENQKALLSGSGYTIGEAIKDLGDISGWYPKLSFCNLILVGEEFKDINVITVLDYFAKTLRLQDSALIAFTQGKASELLQLASPLDNISSFAIQKVILKTDGFDADVAVTDIKTFCAGYYSRCNSSIMPLIKRQPSDENQGKSSNSSDSSSSGGQSSSSGGSSQEQGQTKTDGKFLFNAKTTALFKNGLKVGELDDNLTLIYNALTQKINGTTFAINDVPFKDNELCNYLLSIMTSKRKICLEVDNNNPTLNVDLTLYCKINDQNSAQSDRTMSENLPLPQPLIDRATKEITDLVKELIETSVKTDCDFLNIKEKLYRFNHKQYSRFSENVLSAMQTNINVTISGQK